MKESILISIIIIIIYLFLFHNKKNVVLIEGKDNNKYLVYNDSKKKEAAMILSEIIERIFIIRDYLYNNIDQYPSYASYIIQLYKNLNKDRSLIYENNPHSDLTSFSVNKGEELAFCLKSKKTGEIHQINLLMYVALHEMGHIACPEIGHGNLFQFIFKFLCDTAIKLKLYNYENYESNPVEYCGMVLSSNILN
jgi:hypothetical protein